MDKIDLDAIIYKHFCAASTTMRECITEAIHQALVLASENAEICQYEYEDGNIKNKLNLGQEIKTEDENPVYLATDKESILEIMNLIV